MTSMDAFTKLVILFSYVISILRISMAVDTITTNQHIKDGETIISSGGSFELGFFHPGNSKNRYLGIWYKKVSVRTVVWVANRETPLTDSSGVLKVTDQGTLVILNGTDSIIWSSNSSRSAQNPNVQLLDDPENFLWQSFDYPGNTLLPGMKLGRDKVTGVDRYLSSWTSSDDPSRGNFTFKLDPGGHPQLLVRNGLAVKSGSGPWNGIQFSGFPTLKPNPVYTYTFVFNEKEMSVIYELVNRKITMRLVLSPNGYTQSFTWIDHDWNLYSNTQMDDCDNYALCGVYGICNINRAPKCECMKGFFPKFPSYWDKGDYSSGCVRNASLSCHNGDGFVKYSGLKLPDSQKSWSNESMNLKECVWMCSRNCSCTAYANSDIRGGGSGCLLWFGDLIDIKEFPETGQELYVRMAASELDAFARVHRSKRSLVIISSISTIGIILLSLVLTLCIFKKKKQLKTKGTIFIYNLEGSESEEDLELPLFNLATISNATDNFSSSNKLGQGGFGPVYKGTLRNGKQIAVKRLSKFSTQGLDEFKNEVIYMSKLQHRNLVKLLGCCSHGEEKMLIYDEYMPNKSLNYFIFDQEQNVVLDWRKRFLIINGTARGLLYLHQDSRLRIIHRDLKADNILLDSEMNPKISDFGMARSFRGNEIEANTNTVVGTFGYMSPEYAIAGLYSTKSDVYSFGVSVLEIVSGKRNRGFYHPNSCINLLGHAWTLYMEGRSLEIIDASMGDTYNPSEVLRSIHVGLLCVQRCPDDRPSMSSVILMLGSEGALPQPKEPGFFSERHMLEANSNPEATSFSGNEDIMILLSYVVSILRICSAVDTLTVNQMIQDGETITSAGGSFELGFFSRPANSNKRYLGIWYKKVATGTVAWVANRELPLNDTSGVLKVTDQGKLVLLNGTNTIIWSSNSSRSAQNPNAQLLESGNLVMKNGNDSDPENFLWQSFDYPSSTLLPGMKLGRNIITGLDRRLSSWKSTDDPSRGNFTYLLDPNGFPQLIVMQGSDVTFRSGPWNGLRFSGFPEMRPNPVFKYDFVFNEKEMYFTFDLVNSSVITRLELNPNGDLQRLVWIDRTQGWTVYATAQKDDCDIYALCGGYATCNINDSPRCECMKGFVPKFPDEWNRMDWSGGCDRNIALNCQNGDGFLKYSGIKLPDTRNSEFNRSMNLKDCESLCLRTCSCTAYSNLDISRGGSGCLLWSDNLTDIRDFTEDGQEFYVRMAASEVGSETNERQEDLEWPLFDLATICNATNNFSIDNKLGQGGFGSVYKGMLQDGKEIAVKRLSKNSRQGLHEFQNEVVYISRLQHRNLVKLLGCYIHGEEKMLVYEYMSNKSLDFFIFDQMRSMTLDWPKRFVIINGIARGLLYLHQDSRLRIIHRDLKADNILLDSVMNPKISDFGIARSFGGDETKASTNRVVGTYGYMSPEYAIHGVYSIKSDVFSFGVLVLEIVSGKRNRGFHHPDHDLNLLGHAWTLYMEDRYLELIDKSIGVTCNLPEVLRSINVGLLCVQRSPDDRPSMSSVVQMLGSEGALPRPKEPGFFTETNIHEANSSSSKHAALLGNESSITFLEAR
ncbi:hypothetical protein PVL29_025511 [Vitis rotundifolia]|uniref:non-specific serine/threonine protein kinase n=1 Tax=Vitis rotundifolia TaxID=103349 RepID=A0AA38YK06_VITRO|nr:hypothetical protein PVL29_025511 [Vitis rotundifolia]